MLTMIQDLPEGIHGVRAEGTVTKHDYEAVLRPMLRHAEATATPLRLLYVFGDDFDGFTTDAAWEDVNLAFDHLDDVERCAVVAAPRWVSAVSQLVGALAPFQVQKFSPEDWDDAVDWLDQEAASVSS